MSSRPPDTLSSASEVLSYSSSTSRRASGVGVGSGVGVRVGVEGTPGTGVAVSDGAVPAGTGAVGAAATLGNHSPPRPSTTLTISSRSPSESATKIGGTVPSGGVIASVHGSQPSSADGPASELTSCTRVTACIQSPVAAQR